jgi:hypothetical protein
MVSKITKGKNKNIIKGTVIILAHSKRVMLHSGKKLSMKNNKGQ